jgi:hypothetical protein
LAIGWSLRFRPAPSPLLGQDNRPSVAKPVQRQAARIPAKDQKRIVAAIRSFFILETTANTVAVNDDCSPRVEQPGA